MIEDKVSSASAEEKLHSEVEEVLQTIEKLSLRRGGESISACLNRLNRSAEHLGLRGAVSRLRGLYPGISDTAPCDDGLFLHAFCKAVEAGRA